MAVGKEGNSAGWGAQGGSTSKAPRDTKNGVWPLPCQRAELLAPAQALGGERSLQRCPTSRGTERRLLSRGISKHPDPTTASLLTKQLLGRERAGRGGLPAVPMGINNPKGHPKGFTSPEQQAAHGMRGSEGSI